MSQKSMQIYNFFPSPPNISSPNLPNRSPIAPQSPQSRLYHAPADLPIL